MQHLKNFWLALLIQQERWILWSPAAIALGVGAYFSLHFEPSLHVGLVTLGFLLLSLVRFYRKRAILLLWIPLILITLGFTAAQWRTWSLEAPILAKKTYPLIIQGRVASVEAMPQQTSRIVLTNIQYDTTKPPPQEPMPEKIRIKLKPRRQPPEAGDIIRLKAILLPLSPPVLPGAYDFQRHAFFQGIGATGFSLSEVEVITARPKGYFFETLRRYLRTGIMSAIKNNDAAAITLALLDGEDLGISKETYDTIRTAGIAHLIAISGLQVTLVTGFFFFVVRWILASIPYIALRYPIKKITALIAMGGAVFYMLLIGSSISAERSVIMVCVVMTAIILDRDPFTLRLAAFAAAVILLLQPESLFGPSFQLSFAAVVALIAFYETTREQWSRGYEDRTWFGKTGLYVLGSLATTFIATLATASFALYHFLKTPLFPGLVANLIAVPVSSFITMPMAIIGSLLMPFGLQSIPLQIAGWSVEFILKIAKIVAEWPYAVYSTDAWPMWILVMMTIGGLWLCIWRGKIRLLGILPVLIGIILIPMTPRADILISANGTLLAGRNETGKLFLSSLKAEKFVRQSWVEREGEQGHDLWTAKDSPFTCDDEGCIYKNKNHLVSFMQHYTALERDCPQVGILITPFYLKKELCPQPQWLIHKSSLKYKGAHALYLQDDGTFTVKTVYDERGRRPWALPPRPSSVISTNRTGRQLK